jgi:hypothetical protein
MVVMFVVWCLRSSEIKNSKTLKSHCDFGSRADTVQLLAAFHTNGTVTDLTIQ